ncbi:kelch domain-containing protein 3 [Phlebotomus papatasi]|nr:kelch domain-containing protein 3 [Phlebotomus papatasi]
MYWTVHLEGGPRRVNHAAVSVGNYIYSFGGYCAGEDYRSYLVMDVHVLNSLNMRWSLVPIRKEDYGHPLKYPWVPFQRYGHTAVAYKHLVYVWGGRNDEMVCDILYCFDTRTLKWSAPEVVGSVPGARDGHTACVVGHKMYIFGGFEEAMEQFSHDVHCLDLESMTWRYVQTFGEPPSYRDFHSAVAVHDRMYIFGGRGDRHSPYHSQDEIYNSDIVYLDLKTMTWHMPRTTGTVPLGRRSHSTFVYKNLIYVFGGYNGIHDQHFNDMYSFDPERNVWRLLESRGEVPCARRRHVCLVIGTKLYLFGGTSPSKHSDQSGTNLCDFNDTHVLDFEPTLKTLALMTVLEHRIDQSWLPREIKLEIRSMTTPNIISRPLNNAG